MRAFLGDPAVRDGVLAQVRAHALADEIVQGTYWEGGKGCAVGCTIHGRNHRLYETRLGIPEEIAYLQDALFEALTNGDAKAFPLQFLEAVPIGADLSLVWDKFQHWLLVDPTDGIIALADDDLLRSQIRTFAVLYERTAQGQEPTALELKAAQAAQASQAAEQAAAWEAWEAWAAWGAWEAWEARAARAARGAREARAARAARGAREARAATYRDCLADVARLQRDKLLALLRDAPIAAEVNDG